MRDQQTSELQTEAPTRIGSSVLLGVNPETTNLRADSSSVELPLFQVDDGGSQPTSALQLYFREISPITAAIAYKKWHYLGDQDFISQINFGAYHNQTLEGAISYGPPNATDLKGYWDRHTQGQWWEIKRLVMSPKCPKNSESRFIAITMKMLRKLALVRGVVTYADDGQGHVGTIYKAAGFQPLGLTDQKCAFWVDGKIQQRGKTKGVNGEWKPRSRKWLFVKRYDAQMTPNNRLKNNEHTIPPLYETHGKTTCVTQNGVDACGQGTQAT